MPQDPGEEVPFVNFPEAVFTGCLLAVPGGHDPGDPQPPLGSDVGRRRGDHVGQCAAHLLPSAPAIAGGDLEVPGDLLGGNRLGPARQLLPGRGRAGPVQTPPLHLAVADLEQHARQLDPLWLKAAFLLLLVGYGTKMGLAPLHTWLPDAHSEAPSMVSALLSGVLLNCAFLAILRGHALLVKAGLA